MGDGGKPRRPIAAVLGALVMLAVFFAGCGGSGGETDKQAVSSVAQRWTQALLDGDGAKLCPLMVDTAQRELAGPTRGAAREGCAVRFATIVGVNVNTRERSLATHLRVESVRVISLSASHAVADVRIASEEALRVPLTKTRRGWRVAGFGRCAPRAESCWNGSPGGPTTIEMATPAAVAKAGGQRLTEFEAGKKAVEQSGCLACHKIGENGNAGPGPNHTKVGERLPRQAIARTLVNPTAPMPSFRRLPPQKFRTIVTFLAQLK